MLQEQQVDIEELLAKAKKPSADAMLLHPFYRGKVETVLKCTVRDFNDFAIWYTPGVAAPCKAIPAEPELVYEHTNKWNTVAVVSDGTRVLGLGDIGPKAGLPVMEGKALLYKYLGGVDGVPIMLDTKDPDKIINTGADAAAQLWWGESGRYLSAQVLPHPGHAARKGRDPGLAR
jgi:malate dehydrogenase (oxaloacetate-decarboxylating)